MTQKGTSDREMGKIVQSSSDPEWETPGVTEVKHFACLLKWGSEAETQFMRKTKKVLFRLCGLRIVLSEHSSRGLWRVLYCVDIAQLELHFPEFPSLYCTHEAWPQEKNRVRFGRQK